MTVRTTQGAPRRATSFVPTAPCSSARCPRTNVKLPRRVHRSSTEGFHRDSSGAGAPSSTDSIPPASATTATDQAPTNGSILPTLLALIDHLRNYASSFTQLRSVKGDHSIAPLQLSHGLGYGTLGWARTLRPSNGVGNSAPGVVESPNCYGGDPAMRSLSLPHVRPAASLRGVPRHQPPLPHEMPHQHADDGHLWAGPDVMYLPWGYGPHPQEPSGAGASHLASADSASASPAASPAPVAPSRGAYDASAAGPSMLMVLLLGPSALQAVVGARLSALALVWHSAVSMQQRATMTTLWHVGQAVEAAERARRNMPPPQRVPELVHWGAAAAAVHAEESVALALARTATAASAAAAGVPTAAAALTGSAAATAAAAAVAAPHLPLLRHARRRLLAAATPLLEHLRSVQLGCTTHVLLRFLLFSSVSPRLRRDLLIRLDILAHRATQLALLQEQHDAWAARQAPLALPAPSYGTETPEGCAPTPPSAGTSSRPPRRLHPLQGDSSSSASGGGAAAQAGRIGGAVPSPGSPAPPSSSSGSTSLSARWYRNVFAPEMQSCARQLRFEAPGAPPDDRAAGDPPGRFDLRDLYRLIRIIEVAVEDLEHYS